MSAASARAAGQAAAERLMVDQCTIRRRGTSTVDDNTGEETPTWSDVYGGVCRVQQRTAGAQSYTPGEDQQLLLRVEIQLPLSVTGLRVDDQITITAATHDPDLVGAVLIVRDLFAKSHPTSRRVGVIRRTS
jgi:uncharacterized protein DUF6093